MAKESKNTKNTKNTKEAKATKPVKNSGTSGQTIAITILSTALACFILGFILLLLTGVLTFAPSTNANQSNTPPAERPGMPANLEEPVDLPTDTPSSTPSSSNQSSKPSTNPNHPYSVYYYDETFVRVGDLEFYLPDDFVPARTNGSGLYSYNLVDDEGWADVKIYTEKSSLTPTAYLNNKIQDLKVVNANYDANGTSWVHAESSNNILALATSKNGQIYAVILTVKLPSNDTREAWTMLLQTLYFNK